MDELDQPLTDIEQSRADTGFRFYVCDPETYTALAAAVDASRGYPKQHTKRGLPPVEELPDATDGSGKLIAIDCWRFTPADDAMLEGTAGVQELTHLEFKSLLDELLTDKVHVLSKAAFEQIKPVTDA